MDNVVIRIDYPDPGGGTTAMTATARVTSPGRARQRKAADYVALLEAVKVEIGGPPR